MIPKIIHQTFKTKKLAKDLQDIVTRLKATNPDCEYRFYDNDDCIKFIKENYDAETLELYLMINPKLGMARADFFRYLLMYKVGGVYLDIKSLTLVPIHALLFHSDKFVSAHWGYSRHHSDKLNYYWGEFQNWNIICEPGHPILNQVIRVVKDNIKNYNHNAGYKRDVKNAVLEVTGPIAYSKVILEMKDACSDGFREFESNDALGLMYDAGKTYHHHIYSGYLDGEPVVIK